MLHLSYITNNLQLSLHPFTLCTFITNGRLSK